MIFIILCSKYQSPSDQNGTVIKKNYYYPFGMTFVENTGDDQKKQPYKYNNKELDQMYGVNQYDFEARMLNMDIPRFTSVDSLAEKYYNISPYAYCANNPIKYIDPDGKQVFGSPFGSSANLLRHGVSQGVQNLQMHNAKPAAISASIIGAATFVFMPIMALSIGLEATLITKGPEEGTLAISAVASNEFGTPNLAADVTANLDIHYIKVDERLYSTKSTEGESEGTMITYKGVNVNKTVSDFDGGVINSYGVGFGVKSKSLSSASANKTFKSSKLLGTFKLYNNNNEKYNPDESAKDYYIRKYTDLNEYKNATGSK